MYLINNACVIEGNYWILSSNIFNKYVKDLISRVHRKENYTDRNNNIVNSRHDSSRRAPGTELARYVTQLPIFCPQRNITSSSEEGSLVFTMAQVVRYRVCWLLTSILYNNMIINLSFIEEMRAQNENIYNVSKCS